MIDDQKEAAQLLQDMQEQLPIRVRPTRQLSETLKRSGTELRSDEEMQIESLLYLGDEGGIACGLKWPGAGKNAVVVSLTHVRVDNGHPLAARIETYQSTRSMKIAMMNSAGGPSRGGVKPSEARSKRRGRRRR